MQRHRRPDHDHHRSIWFAHAKVDGIDMRLPYQSDPTVRAQINSGHMQYVDIHLSHVAQQVWEGY